MNEIKLPKCSMAADDDVMKQKREELRRRLMNGDPIPLKKGGEVTSGNDNDVTLTVPKGKLADAIDDAMRQQRDAAQNSSSSSSGDPMAQKREELRRRLMNGDPIPLKKGGEVTSGNDKDVSISIPQGKLAALLQWYERDPMLLEAEKAAMNKDFPQFSLIKLDDGRLAWVGDVSLNVGGCKKWRLMAVYQPNHPVQQMGSSVYVYLVDPSIEALIEQLGWRPHHLLRDSNNRNYLCTTEAGYVKASSTQVTSANTVMRWAIKWLLCFELVLTGDMTTEEFDKPHGI
jgi:hypothetical protein